MAPWFTCSCHGLFHEVLDVEAGEHVQEQPQLGQWFADISYLRYLNFNYAITSINEPRFPLQIVCKQDRTKKSDNRSVASVIQGCIWWYKAARVLVDENLWGATKVVNFDN